MPSSKAPLLSGLLTRFAGTVARTYYHLTIAGESVAYKGPVLLVANHTNALLDPALVLAAANRPVRMLAKSTLLKVPVVGRLMRLGGCIPVYRRQDATGQMGRNAEMFSAVEEVLAHGGAVGLFPEGISHDLPSLVPLKTGAARIALGTAIHHGVVVPIIPVGLVFQDKAIFRSEAMVMIGAPIPWADIAAFPSDDTAAHELTKRISAALRTVTVNLESWADRPLIECAEGVYSAEAGESPEPGDQVYRQQMAATTLEHLRDADDPRWPPLATRLRNHERRLEWLGLSPQDLAHPPSSGAVSRWTMRTLPIFATLWFAVLGLAAYWPPYRLTGMVAARLSHERDTDASYKAITAMVFMGVWTVLIAAAVAVVGGLLAGAFTLLLLPLTGIASLTMAERWRHSQDDARRFLLMRRQRARIATLQRDQLHLAEELTALVQQFASESSRVS